MKIKLLMNKNSSIKINFEKFIEDQFLNLKYREAFKIIRVNDLSENLINSSSLIKKYNNCIEKMNSLIEYLTIKFRNFISVKNNSILGPVVILINITDINNIIYSYL